MAPIIPDISNNKAGIVIAIEVVSIVGIIIGTGKISKNINGSKIIIAVIVIAKTAVHNINITDQRPSKNSIIVLFNFTI
jgi:hypothetical protein